MNKTLLRPSEPSWGSSFHERTEELCASFKGLIGVSNASNALKLITIHRQTTSSKMTTQGPNEDTNELSTVSPPNKSIKVKASGTTVGILDLPDDIISRIFSKFEPVPELCLLMGVCTKFANAASAPELWRRVKAVDPITRRAKEEGIDISSEFIVYDLDKGPDKSMLSTSEEESHRLTRRGVGLAVDVITSRAGSQLVSLDLHDCYPRFPRFDHQMSDAHLELISSRCSDSLQILRLSASFLIRRAGLVNLAKSCPKLRTLHVTGCKNMNDEVLGDIVRECPTLEDISVSGCRNFEAEGLHENLSPIRDTLKRIDISGSYARSIHMLKFMTKYPALEEIDASDCERLYTPTMPPTSLPIFPSLVSLKMDKASSIGDKMLLSICEGSRNLRCLSLNNMRHEIHEEELRNLFDLTWPPLKTLKMAGQKITDEMWQRIFEKLGASLVECDLSKNRLLTCSLQLFRNDSFAELQDLRIRSTGATNSTVKTLISISPKLKFLDVCGCVGVERKLRRNPLALRESANNTEPTIAS